VFIAVYAALAMVLQDILGTLMVQAEARNKGLLAGLMDGLAWVAAISTTSIAVTTLQGHDMAAKIMVIVLVSLANVFGTWLGVLIGKRWIK
jgi:hypothetical protein